jgi:hypothetical protein
MFSFVFPSLRPATVLFPKSNRSMKQSLYQCHAKKLVRLVNRLHWGANTCNRICINAYTPWPSNLLYIVHTSELLHYILLFTNMSVFFFQSVRFAGLLWLKVLFASLLWEKNTAGWLLIPLNSSNEQVFIFSSPNRKMSGSRITTFGSSCRELSNSPF